MPSAAQHRIAPRMLRSNRMRSMLVKLGKLLLEKALLPCDMYPEQYDCGAYEDAA